MRIIIFYVILLSAQIQAKSQKTLNSFCQDYGGEVKFGFICPKSKIPLPINMCHFTNSYGEKQFFDGCTAPTGEFTEDFYPACIKHDLCYHHEPVSNGLSQKDCDNKFFSELKLICAKENNKKKCLRYAHYLYKGVRSIGIFAFLCENIKAHY